MSVNINKKLCEDIASAIKSQKFRADSYNRDYLTIDVDPETKMRAYLFSVAICHQTHTLISEKLNLVGWDYIEYAFTYLMRTNSLLLQPDYVLSLSLTELGNKLDSLFTDCILDRLEERAKLYAATAKLIKESGGRITDVYKGNIISLYELLEPIFKDPLHKKATLFAKNLEESKLQPINDPENILAPMDYHIQRVLLRTGCIEVDEQLKQILINKEKIDSDYEIRQASIDIIKLLSRLTSYSLFEIGDILWSLARSCCKDKLLCLDKDCNKHPCTLTLLLELPKHDTCIFEGICKASKDSKYKKLWQPIVDTTSY